MSFWKMHIPGDCRGSRHNTSLAARSLALFPSVAAFLVGGCATPAPVPNDLAACARMLASGLRPIADDRADRFLGKVTVSTAQCRGGDRAVMFASEPWVDWQTYWATGDAKSRAPESALGTGLADPNSRGVDGALIDLEYQRIELLKFNLFDNSGTFAEYVRGRDGVPGPSLKAWDAMRLPPDDSNYALVGGAGQQKCKGELIRFRTVTGICNDLQNPLMGSTGQPFARNVTFDATFPEVGNDAFSRNRHGGRLGLLQPDPQVISRKLLTRAQSEPSNCNEGRGLPDHSVKAHCDYKKASFLNVLAAFWIQFMTHDWFSHLREGHGQSELMLTGCRSQRIDNVEAPLTTKDAARLGCRPDDRIERSYVAEDGAVPTFTERGRTYATRAFRTSQNTVTAWWDASQLYGYDETSRARAKRDPTDSAKLLLVSVAGRTDAGDALGYLPQFDVSDAINPDWAGQEATAFPDNWSVGMSFFHNVFAREHNVFVDAFRRRAATTPDDDCGLRDPGHPDKIIKYRDVTSDELFEIARLVIAAEIAKIHTLEWTTQLLYDEPLYLGMNSNWGGFLPQNSALSAAIQRLMSEWSNSEDPDTRNARYSALSSGSGIFGHGNARETGPIRATGDRTDLWNLRSEDDINGGTNHFGSPFAFPEEFITVYRLHAMVPDLLELRDERDPNVIRNKIPVVETLRGGATTAVRRSGLAGWALSMGRQRLGRLTLQNDPQFLQNLPMPHLDSPTGRIDVAALDILRDREHGVPRFNEFRRQYGLKQLTSFDDLVDRRLAKDSAERREQERLAGLLREVYGQHRCDASKRITEAQRNADGSEITDCLAMTDGSVVDNIEDLDTIVGVLAESARPHGFAISETQLQVFILNASRRLFSDRFFTSSFRPEFYTRFGVEWVTNNGPEGKQMEKRRPNGHRAEILPFKRVLLRTVPELAPELEHVINTFDPWARERGEYYQLDWKPRPGAESDPSFRETR